MRAHWVWQVMLELRPVGDDSAPGLRPRWDIQGSGLANISPAVTPVKKAPAVVWLHPTPPRRRQLPSPPSSPLPLH